MNYLIIITQADVFVLRRYIVLHILLPINNPGKKHTAQKYYSKLEQKLGLYALFFFFL